MELGCVKEDLGLPSLEWNRRWALKFEEFRKKNPGGLYGSQWGDPEVRGIRYFFRRVFFRRAAGPLYRVVDDYIRPYVKPDATVLEIGPGGGRWTRYLVSAKKVVAVDINAEFFAPLRAMFPDANLGFYQPEGFDLRGVAADSIDFVFTFGTFVHIDPDGIREYLGEIRRVLKRGGTAVVQYAAKEKPAGRKELSFSEMTAEKMAAMAPMEIVEHNTRLLSHSNIAVFRK
ncbi:MAG: methyltransferase domain-containing protein [Candidatus Binatus sp.]